MQSAHRVHWLHPVPGFEKFEEFGAELDVAQQLASAVGGGPYAFLGHLWGGFAQPVE